MQASFYHRRLMQTAMQRHAVGCTEPVQFELVQTSFKSQSEPLQPSIHAASSGSVPTSSMHPQLVEPLQPNIHAGPSGSQQHHGSKEHCRGLNPLHASLHQSYPHMPNLSFPVDISKCKIP